jgi:uncharacterized protein HemX
MPEPTIIEPLQASPESIQATIIQQPVSSSNQQLKTIVSVPDAPFDINKVVQTTGGGAGVAFFIAMVMMIITIVGWKLWQKFSKQKQNKIIIENQSSSTDVTNVEELEERLLKIEKKVKSLSSEIV